jgi:2-polyprenyl-3-methyl-5-hydroxy-6-metoxy-1,4-benzoquinol methylase
MEQVIRESVVPLTCLMCGGVENRRVFNEHGIDIVRCRGCGHVFSSYPANPHHAGYWGEEVEESDHVYWKTARAPMYADFFGRFIAGRSGRLLDMGCGLGFFVKAMGAHPAWETHGREISPAAVRYAREKLGLGNVSGGRLEDAALPDGSFDLITMWDVIDHIPRPDPALRRCHELLKDGGRLFLRTPNVAVQLPRAWFNRLVRGMRPGVTYLQARDHAHHYSTASISRLLERNGFTAIEFLHLRPVGSVSTGSRRLRGGVKRLGFEAVRALARASGGRLNFDNLFVVARKGAGRELT